MDFRVISIGALSRHELWNEPAPVRTAHATTTLVRTEDRVIVVDPGLPGKAVAARLHERSGLKPEQVTDVFLTCFRPAHRWGLDAFPNARWLIAEAEREHIGRALVEQFEAEQEDARRDQLRDEIAILKKCQTADDHVAKQVDLFPLPGYTPGACGLLLLEPNRTTLLAGDAVASVEHLERGQTLRGAFDLQQAVESLTEAIEIADVIVPGHDNIIHNPTRRGL